MKPEAMYQNELVSIIVPCYNRDNFVVEALDSCHAQTYRPLQVVIVDDGSTDGSQHIIESWISFFDGEKDFHASLVRKENGGAPSARNVGIQKSVGEYVQFLDSDDLLHHEKIEKQVNYLKKNPDVEFVYSKASVFFESKGDTDKIVGSKDSMTLAGHVGKHAIKTDLGLYRRSLLKKMGPWNESLKIWQEGEFNLRLFTRSANIAFLPEVLAYYRLHDSGRISSGISNKKTLHSLSEMKKTATQSLSANDMKIFNRVLSSRYLSVAIHSVKDGVYDVAKSASRFALKQSIESKSLDKMFKGLVFFIVCTFFPKNTKKLAVNCLCKLVDR